jgi:hypothetical protein
MKFEMRNNSVVVRQRSANSKKPDESEPYGGGKGCHDPRTVSKLQQAAVALSIVEQALMSHARIE